MKTRRSLVVVALVLATLSNVEAQVLEDFEAFGLGALDGQAGWSGSPQAQVIDSDLPGFGNRSIRIRSFNRGDFTSPDIGAGYGRFSFDIRIDSIGADAEYVLTTLWDGGRSDALHFYPGGRFTMDRSVGTCLINDSFVDGLWSPDTTHRLEWTFEQRRPGRDDVTTLITLDDQVVFDGLSFLGCNLPEWFKSFSLSVANNELPYITIDNLDFEPFLPTPDLDGNGWLDIDDLDLLSSTVHFAPLFGASPMFDLNADGDVDNQDVDFWLMKAGAQNLPSGNAYLRGDANLDGIVDGADFLVWNANKFESYQLWSGGDFNEDGRSDGADFLVWNQNKFRSADLATVPEPSGWLLLFVAAVPLWRLPFRR